MYYNEISYLPIEDFNKKESTFDFLGFTSSSNVEINNLRNEYKGFNLYMKWHTYLNAEGPLDAPDVLPAGSHTTSGFYKRIAATNFNRELNMIMV